VVGFVKLVHPVVQSAEALAGIICVTPLTFSLAIQTVPAPSTAMSLGMSRSLPLNARAFVTVMSGLPVPASGADGSGELPEKPPSMSGTAPDEGAAALLPQPRPSTPRQRSRKSTLPSHRLAVSEGDHRSVRGQAAWETSMQGG
jgi:hypothetical protein